MRLADKYLLRSFLIPLFYCLCIFTSIYLIVDLFGHLDEIIKEQIGIKTLFMYYCTYCPSIAVQIMPITILIATMYTLGNLARHNEITALRAGGISIWHIVKPFLITGLLISSFILIINDRVVPASTRLFLKIKEEKIEKKGSDQTTSDKPIRDVALYGMGNKIIYARRYYPKTKILRDMVIHEHDRHQNITSKTTAREAWWSDSQWIAVDITTYKLDKEGRIREEPRFRQRGTLNLNETPEEFQKQKYKTEVLTMSELRTYIKRLSGSGGLILQNLLIEAHNRVAYPFANLIAVLIGAAFSLRTRRSGRLLGIGMGFLIGLFFYGVSAVCVALGKGGVLPAFISVWLSNVLFGSWGIYLINKY